MVYTATAMARHGSTWSGHDVDLAEVEDLDTAVDVARDLAGDADTVLLLVEEDDEYVGIVRATGQDDPQVFLSDRRVLETSSLAERLFGDAVPFAEPDAEEEEAEEDSPSPDAEPAGEPGLLADLGTDAAQLLELCAEEGMLPADVIYAVCEKAGCVDVLEEVRGGL